MLSIGKLASMAEGPAATSQEKVQGSLKFETKPYGAHLLFINPAFNNSLDFMAIHHTLLEQFNEELGNPANFAVESRVRAITSARCVVPSDRPALQDVGLARLLRFPRLTLPMQLFQRILRQFLQGNALTEADAVDILSLKDNTEWPTDFVDALIILSNSQVGSPSVTLDGDINTSEEYVRKS
jgi:nuclear pore complex protein Nup133